MHIAEKQYKPLSSVELSADERKMVAWMRSAKWEPAQEGRLKAKVPEFYNGVRMYSVQGGGVGANAHGALGLLIKKLEFQGVISKQDMYPVSAAGAARYVSFTKQDLDTLGIGQDEEED